MFAVSPRVFGIESTMKRENRKHTRANLRTRATMITYTHTALPRFSHLRREAASSMA